MQNYIKRSSKRYKISRLVPRPACCPEIKKKKDIFAIHIRGSFQFRLKLELLFIPLEKFIKLNSSLFVNILYSATILPLHLLRRLRSIALVISVTRKFKRVSLRVLAYAKIKMSRGHR